MVKFNPYTKQKLQQTQITRFNVSSDNRFTPSTTETGKLCYRVPEKIVTQAFKTRIYSVNIPL